jgi:hypothetical protein
VTFRLYVEEADNDANKVSQSSGAHPAGERIANQKYITDNYRLQGGNYKRMGMRTFYDFNN